MEQVQRHLRSADLRIGVIVNDLQHGFTLQESVEAFMALHLWVQSYWRSADEQVALAFPDGYLKPQRKKD